MVGVLLGWSAAVVVVTGYGIIRSTMIGVQASLLAISLGSLFAVTVPPAVLRVEVLWNIITSMAMISC